jgi:hypothetical protein
MRDDEKTQRRGLVAWCIPYLTAPGGYTDTFLLRWNSTPLILSVIASSTMAVDRSQSSFPTRGCLRGLNMDSRSSLKAIASIRVAAWGVCFALLYSTVNLVRNPPYCRSPQADQVHQQIFSRLSKDEMIAIGELRSLSEGRELVRRSFSGELYEPTCPSNQKTTKIRDCETRPPASRNVCET